MADAKISALPASTTPLAGTETLPIVQGGVTKKVSVDDLTTGKNVPANGIAFPATQVPSADPNTLDDYEEGTWTPNQGAGLTVVGAFSSTGRYTKIGRQVFLQGKYTGATSIAAAGGGVMSTNLPFTVGAGFDGVGSVSNAALSVSSGCIAGGGSTIMYAVANTGTTTTIYFSCTYTI